MSGVYNVINKRAGVKLMRQICLHNAHKLDIYTRQTLECYITLFDADERKLNYIKCREGIIGKVLHLIWRLISLKKIYFM